MIKYLMYIIIFDYGITQFIRYVSTSKFQQQSTIYNVQCKGKCQKFAIVTTTKYSKENLYE